MKYDPWEYESNYEPDFYDIMDEEEIQAYLDSYRELYGDELIDGNWLDKYDY